METKREQGQLYLYQTKQTLSQKLTKDKEGHYLMIKESIHQEDITIVNIYASNIKAPKYSEEILTDLKGEIDKITIIIGEFNTLLSTMDRSSRQRINKETLDLKYTLHQLDLTDIYRTFCPTAAESTHSSQV